MPKQPKPVVRQRSGPSVNVLMTIAILVVAVLVVGGILLFSGNGGGQEATGGQQRDLLRDEGSHTLIEAPESRVTVVEFLDFQCPACAGYYQNVTKQLERDYAGKIKFAVRNFPLEMHALAMPAARAAEAAALQGEYAAMYHALYDDYESWAVAEDGSSLSSDLQRAQREFDRFAREIGLDLDRFHRDMNSERVTQRIEEDKARGTKAGVTSTPTIFVNGAEFETSAERWDEVAADLREQIDEELGR